MKKHFYLMRHGQTLFNVYRRIQGWCDSPLTEVGINQAIEARKLIEGINFDHYYCSTAERASDTLELVTDNTVPYTRLKGLKERYFGVFEGQSEDLNPPGPLYDQLFTIYGGETGEEVAMRVKNTVSELLDRDDHQCILAVSHAGASMNFLRYVKEDGIGRRFGNCEILHFTYENGEFEFVELLSNG